MKRQQKKKLYIILKNLVKQNVRTANITNHDGRNSCLEVYIP
jgi:hypothetical protein